MSKFDERVELKNKLDEIRKDVFANYPNKLNIINKYLKVFPNDQDVLMLRVIVLIENNEYDLAINELENILKKFPDNIKALKKLFLLYYHTREYQKAYDMILDVYKAEIFTPYCTRVIEIFLEHKLGLITNLDIKKTYSLKQLKNYDINEAVKHINEHLYVEELDGNNPNVTFNKRIDLNKLIHVTKENIKVAKRASKLDIFDIYYFSLQNIGVDNGNIYNAFQVVVLPETDNIITMYPSDEAKANEINYLNMMGINIYKDEYIKDSSQIDKFNRRFNR